MLDSSACKDAPAVAWRSSRVGGHSGAGGNNFFRRWRDSTEASFGRWSSRDLEGRCAVVKQCWDRESMRECDAVVRAGVKPPGAVCVTAELIERENVSERLGDTVLVEKSSFRGFRVDAAEEGHCFSSIVTGRKIWMFCLPSPTGKKLDAAARDRRKGFSETINLLQGLSRTQARQVSWTLLEPGSTVYFPYLFLHSVWTDVQPGSVCTMYSCERTVEERWRTEQMRRADQYLALRCRRGGGRIRLQFLIEVCISVFFIFSWITCWSAIIYSCKNEVYAIKCILW